MRNIFSNTIVALVLLAASACGVKPAITTRVTLDFPADPHRVHVSAITELSKQSSSPAAVARLTEAREAIAGSRDEWALRFAALHPDEERVTVERRYGEITRVERMATIDRDELPRFFGDASMTVSLTRTSGVSELTIIPAASARATRQQREHVMQTLHGWSREAAAYVVAMGGVYQFIETHPQSAASVFDLLLGDRDKRAADDEEQGVIETAWNAMDRILESLDQKDEALTVDEEFDLVFNPFPAEIVVHAPHSFTAIENFTKQDDEHVVIHHAGLLDAVESLRGRFLTPDPLAATIRDEHPAAEAMAAEPRHWSVVVSAKDIEDAVVEKLLPAAVYRVRWND